MSAPTLRMLSVRLARHWLLTLAGSLLAVFTASYFYFTTMHALKSFDTGSCTPLALDSPAGECVSRLQKLLEHERPYPAIPVDGHFGLQTQEAVIDFQSDHHLVADGVVGVETADVINEYAPRPGIFSYTAGFVNSQLALSAKLCVAILAVAATIMCLLLRAICIGSGGPLRPRYAASWLFAGFIAASSTATENLMTQAHGWALSFLCIILVALVVALAQILTYMFPMMSTLTAFADSQPQEAEPQRRAG